MQILADRLVSLSLATPTTYGNLTCVPLIGADAAELDYLLLEEAINEKFISVTEVSESGSVPELLLENHSDKAVLLVDGQELVGARQNRVLNLTILAPAGQTIIPVSCVEAGRWGYERNDNRSYDHGGHDHDDNDHDGDDPDDDDDYSFGCGGGCHYSSGRSERYEHVTKSIRSSGSRRSDQGEVWENISNKLQRMGSNSSTEAMADMYEDHKDSVESYVQALPPIQGQVGSVFAVNGQVRGLELFDCAAALSGLYPKLIRSWALDAIEEQQNELYDNAEIMANAVSLIKSTAEATSTNHPAVGEGEDLRISADNLTGGGLIARGRLVHFCSFKTNTEADNENSIHMQRASARSRAYDND